MSIDKSFKFDLLFSMVFLNGFVYSFSCSPSTFNYWTTFNLIYFSQ